MINLIETQARLEQKVKTVNHKYLVAAIILIGCITRFYALDFQSPWLDEVHTINETAPNLSLSEIFDLIKITEPAPPLYFIVCHYLVKFFGYTILTLRIFSAVVGVLGILAIYYLGKEMFDRKVGTISAVFLLFNFFHIFYSQEARVYSLFFLSSTLSFYFFVRFIKAPTLISSLLYGLGASLLIYSHYFGFFVLASQCLILLYLLTLGRSSSVAALFKYSIVAGLITILLFIPSLGFLQASMARTEIWIPIPTLATLIDVYEDLFGKSNWLVFGMTGLILLTILVTVLPTSRIWSGRFSEPGHGFKGGLAILFVWIVVTMALAFILSYVNLPMIVNRYLICILPAILIAGAVGISLSNNLVTVLAVVVVFAGANAWRGRAYYNTLNRQQFSELAHLNFKNEPVVSRYTWYLPFFVRKADGLPALVDKTIDRYVQFAANDTTKLSSFWYIDLTWEGVSMKDSTRQFLDRNYQTEAYLTFFGVKAIHYSRPGEVESEWKMILQRMANDAEKKDTCDVSSYVDSFEVEGNVLKTAGWAFLKDEDSFDSHIRLFVRNGGLVYRLPTTDILRQDLSKAFSSKRNYDFAGFNVDAPVSNLPEGKYELHIYLFNERLGRTCDVATGKSFEILKEVTQ
jgi:mannosyltransferase